MSYLDSYLLRMQRNHNSLMEFAKPFLEAGYIIRIWKNEDRYYSSFTLYEDLTFSKGVRLQFSEVPYRWKLEYDINPSGGQGSGYTGMQRHINSYEIPYTFEEIIQNIRPMFYDKRFETYHKIVTKSSELPALIEIED